MEHQPVWLEAYEVVREVDLADHAWLQDARARLRAQRGLSRGEGGGRRGSG